ncbi:MAG: hypothetical protein AB7T49_00215 [Oligoflexales bacterium]
MKIVTIFTILGALILSCSTERKEDSNDTLKEWGIYVPKVKKEKKIEEEPTNGEVITEGCYCAPVEEEVLAPPSESVDNALSCIEGYDVPTLVQTLSLPSIYETKIVQVTDRGECPYDMMKIRFQELQTAPTQVELSNQALTCDCAYFPPSIYDVPQETVHCVSHEAMREVITTPSANTLGEFLMDKTKVTPWSPDFGCDSDSLVVKTKAALR